jgi:hypothetical protein
MFIKIELGGFIKLNDLDSVGFWIDLDTDLAGSR